MIQVRLEKLVLLLVQPAFAADSSRETSNAELSGFILFGLAAALSRYASFHQAHRTELRAVRRHKRISKELLPGFGACHTKEINEHWFKKKDRLILQPRNKRYQCHVRLISPAVSC